MIEVFSESALSHVLTHVPHKVKSLWIMEGAKERNPRLENLFQLARSHKVPIEIRKKNNKLDESIVGAKVLPPDLLTLGEVFEKNPKFLLGLDHIQDPQNFGAICRTAEALGVGAVIFPKDRSVTIGAGVYAASVGAIETVPLVAVANLRDAMKKAKEQNYWVMGAAKTTESITITKAKEYEKKMLVLGSEWDGLSEHVQKDCDLLVSVPMAGKVESLNVSAAGAILMYELIT